MDNLNRFYSLYLLATPSTKKCTGVYSLSWICIFLEKAMYQSLEIFGFFNLEVENDPMTDYPNILNDLPFCRIHVKLFKHPVSFR